MDCIYCSGKTGVSNSRPQKRLQQVWRRRNCKHCGAIFTTIEAVELAGSLVVTGANGSIQPFNRDTLYISIYSSLKHRTDAVSAASALTATTIAKLRSGTSSAHIDRTAVVKTATEVLRRFDKAASVQYAAYHTL